MNKPYFTKYIQVGDDPVDINVALSDKENNYIAITGHTGSFVKVKLFLCSRDIQIGDMIQCKDSIKPIVYDSNLEDLLTENYWFKVIGEVSPNAIWVKEGMEFEEDNVRWCLWQIDNKCFRDDVDKNQQKNWLKKFPQDYIEYYQFKCPTCNTFH